MGSTDSASKKKKIAIIGVSSILLVAAVVGTVTYGVTKTTGQSNNDSQLSASSKAAETVCSVTDYKETCEKSLSNAKDKKDVKELIQVALHATIDSVKEVLSNSSALTEAAKDPNVSAAFHVCNQTLDLSIYELERSIDKINGTFDNTNFDEYLGDLRTWLSGAISFQEACLDAFDNSTGETGEKMKQLMNTSRELASNGLAMVTELSHLLAGAQIPGLNSRRLLESGSSGRIMFDDVYIPNVIYDPLIPLPRDSHHKEGNERMMMNDYYPPEAVHTRRLLQAHRRTLKPNAVVALDGSGQFRSIQAAINTAPQRVNHTFLILIKAGVYHEYVEIPKYTYNIFLLGEGPTRTRITGHKNFVDGVKTWDTATVGVNGDNFIARDIGFENTAGGIKHQAVALRVSADKAIFFNCHIDGFQDTLYSVSQRQYYRDCTISGTIDFIFGDAASVFQNCKLIVRKPLASQSCMVTAQGRAEARSNGATVLQNCAIVPAPDFFTSKPVPKAYLGRPWKQYSRTLIMQSFIDGFIAPEGWAPWAGNFALDTLQYGEFENRGPGANTVHRVKWKGIQHITPAIAQSFTPGSYLHPQEWLQPSGIPYAPGLMRV